MYQVFCWVLYIGIYKPYEVGILGSPIFIEEESGSEKLSNFS